MLVAVLVAIWALRLGTFLVLRISADGSDSRFDEIKQDPLQFAMSWTLQALWVVLTLAAAMALMSTAAPPAISWVTVVGLAIWVGGFSVEVVADAQKRRFRADPANEGRFISTGLWSWSRHPNYFGEITLWVGIAVIVLLSLDGWRYVALISPVFVAVLLHADQRSADARGEGTTALGRRSFVPCLRRAHSRARSTSPLGVVTSVSEDRRRSTVRRRVRSISVVVAVALGLLVAFPPLLVLLATVDLVRLRPRLPLVRLVSFGLCWAWLEVAGVAAAALLWLTGRRGDLDVHYRLQRWWADRLMRALRATCGITVDVGGVDALQPAPAVVLVRHASLADSLLTAWVVITCAGLRPRFVLKRELLADPCLDIVGSRLPNCFLDRQAEDSAPGLAQIAAMGSEMTARDVAIIFPEGTRANDAKRRRALERIGERDPRRRRPSGRAHEPAAAASRGDRGVVVARTEGAGGRRLACRLRRAGHLPRHHRRTGAAADSHPDEVRAARRAAGRSGRVRGLARRPLAPDRSGGQRAAFAHLTTRSAAATAMSEARAR